MAWQVDENTGTMELFWAKSVKATRSLESYYREGVYAIAYIVRATFMDTGFMVKVCYYCYGDT